MMQLGIIEMSTSQWDSHIVLVPNKNRSLRFCIDLRYLKSYPMPSIDELLERVGNATFITTLDLSWGRVLAAGPGTRDKGAGSIFNTLWQVPIQGDAIRSPGGTSYVPKDHGSGLERGATVCSCLPDLEGPCGSPPERPPSDQITWTDHQSQQMCFCMPTGT